MCNTIKAMILELHSARGGRHIHSVPQRCGRLAILRRVQQRKARGDGVAVGQRPVEDGGNVHGVLHGRA